MNQLATDFDKLMNSLNNTHLISIVGRIVEVVGMLIKAVVPDVKVGEVCFIKRDKGDHLVAEVV